MATTFDRGLGSESNVCGKAGGIVRASFPTQVLGISGFDVDRPIERIQDLGRRLFAGRRKTVTASNDVLDSEGNL